MNFLKPKTYNLKPNSRGFTILELLVVIAIIALLSSIAFVGIQGARQRGKDAAMVSIVNDIYKEASICLERGYLLNTPLNASGGGGLVCAIGTLNYPATPVGSNWKYDMNNITSNVEGGRLYIRAISPSNATSTNIFMDSTSTIPGSTTATKIIYCEQVEGCKKSGF